MQVAREDSEYGGKHQKISLLKKFAAPACRNPSTQLCPNARANREITLSLATLERSALLIFRSVAFGSAECDDRQGQIGLVAEVATGDVTSGGFDHGSRLRVAAPGTWRGGGGWPPRRL